MNQLTRQQAKEISSTVSIINKRGIEAVKNWGILSKDVIEKLIANANEFITFKGELSTFLDGIKHERLHGEAISIQSIESMTNSSLKTMKDWLPKLLKQ